MKNVVLLSLSVILLASCASTYSSKGLNVQNADAQSFATLEYYSNAGSFLSADWMHVNIVGVNGEPTSNFFSGPPTKAHVPPGENSFLLDATLNRGWNDVCPCDVLIPIKAHLEGGKSYKIEAKTEEGAVSVWISDAVTSGRVSDVVSKAYEKTPPPPMIIMY